MAKKNNFVKKNSQQAKTYSERHQNSELVYALKLLAICEQEMLDTAAVTLHKEFGFGPERQKRFHDRFEEVFTELRKIEREDAADKEYYIETVERSLKEATGKYYVPRDERYDIHVVDKYGNTWNV